jgi:predicted RNase H-like HicB family nuclease
MNYKVLITYDKEYEGYVVDVPQLPGCMSQGKSLDEAIVNIKDAIAGWLYVENLHGRTYIPEETAMFLGEVFV